MALPLAARRDILEFLGSTPVPSASIEQLLSRFATRAAEAHAPAPH